MNELLVLELYAEHKWRSLHVLKMNKRLVNFVLAINIVLTVTREVFDLIGRLWLPILWNFVNLLAVVIALFGVGQGRRTLSFVYCCWMPLWTCWNVLVLCFYLNVSGLHDDDQLLASLNFGTTGRSWWYDKVPFCQQDPYNISFTGQVVKQCLVDHKAVEMVIALVHIFCSCLCLIFLLLHEVEGCCRRTKPQNVDVEQRRHRPTVTVEFSGGQSTNATKCSRGKTTQRNSVICTSCLPDRKSCDESVASGSFQNSRYLVPNYKRPSAGNGRSSSKPAVDRIRQEEPIDNIYSGSCNGDVFHNLGFSDNGSSRSLTTLGQNGRQTDVKREPPRVIGADGSGISSSSACTVEKNRHCRRIGETGKDHPRAAAMMRRRNDLTSAHATMSANSIIV
ncbi:unnamed protein product [Soboliphyme baturini]|uniref:Sodium/potassium-transporting ATPase subunit beta-1-interacting protein n=1 Tax=Soboliphyme baturini TaxID=241478 RepID=A0A183IHE6_9BILA|nr:unnamed protein product [Soboliphyme baturini]